MDIIEFKPFRIEDKPMIDGFSRFIIMSRLTALLIPFPVAGGPPDEVGGAG